MLLAGALTLAAAPAAHAGTYTVYACATPNGTPAPAEGWSTQDETGGGINLGAGACPNSGPMRAELHGGRQFAEGQHGDLIFTAPPGLPLVGYVLYRNAVVRQTDYGSYHYDLLSYDTEGRQRQPADEYCHVPCSLPSPPAPSDLSEQNSISRTTRSSRLAVRVSCAPDPSTIKDQHPEVCNPVGNASPAAAYVHRAEMVLEDNSDPEFTSPPAGTMFDTGRELSGTVSASFAARDQGSGVYQAVVEVDGRPVVTAPIDDNGGKCRKPFVARVPCKAGASAAGTVSLDTTVLPDGPHNVRLLVQDATGTNEIPYGPVSITTRNSVPGRGTPNGVNAADGAIMQVKWKGRKGRELRSPFNRSVAVEGTLRNPAGQPIIGATVVLQKTDLRPGAREETLATVVTKVDGTFGHRFRARPGMRIAVRYRAFAGDAGNSAEQRLTLRVRAAATLRTPKVVRRGQRLRFSGRLRGRPIPRGGKLVQLQFQVGRRWRDSGGIVRTDRRGNFRGVVGTRPGGGRETLRLRILVRREASYPYSMGASPTRRVTLIP